MVTSQLGDSVLTKSQRQSNENPNLKQENSFELLVRKVQEIVKVIF